MKDLIICHPQGASMSDLEFDENLLEPLAGHPLSSPEPSNDSKELAERITERMGIRVRFDILTLMHKNLKEGGAIITFALIFRWLTIGISDENFDLQPSIFLSLSFNDVATLIIALSVCWVIFNDLGRDGGNLFFSLFAGTIMIFSALYIGEPVVMLMVGSDLSAGEAIWRSVRLIALGGGVTYGMKLLMDAMKLRWLKAFLDGHELELNIPEELEIEETQEA